MDYNIQEIDGQCHCGAVRFHAILSDGLRTARRCNCSYCRMRGAVMVTAGVNDITVTAGADKLTLYQFGTKTAKHYFCSVCGIYTHHQRRSNPLECGINVACLNNLSPFDFHEVPVNEGAHHSFDRAQARAVAGTLKYTPL